VFVCVCVCGFVYVSERRKTDREKENSKKIMLFLDSYEIWRESSHEWIDQLDQPLGSYFTFDVCDGGRGRVHTHTPCHHRRLLRLFSSYIKHHPFSFSPITHTH